MNYTYYRRYQSPSRKRKQNQFGGFFWLGVILIILTLILKACVSLVVSFSDEKKDDIILSVERGGGEVLSFGQSVWEVAPDLGVILEGDSVQSDDESYLLLTVQGGPVLRMDEGTYLSFDSVEVDENDLTKIHLFLHDGRVWYEGEESTTTSVVIHTDIMEIDSGGQFLLSNLASNESIYVFDGTVGIDYLDRGLDDVVLESLVLKANEKSLISEEIERALIAREVVVLRELMEEGELSENELVKWSLGENRVIEVEEEEIIEEEPEEVIPEEEEIIEEAVEPKEAVIENLSISITSPGVGASDSDGAIAIEGVVTAGSAVSVYVSWSGTGQSYPLGLFQAGDGSFRYVADVQYANFASGNNTYTITAYDADGNESNTVSIDILGDF
ncbi:MAG: hypothetical protein ACI9QC_000212 [Oceanicoccus sp.]|jgi:hypothetical protein